VLKLSFTATGTQNNAPRGSPAAVLRSSASACAMALGLRVRKALSGGPALVSRSRAAMSVKTARIAAAHEPGCVACSCARAAGAAASSAAAMPTAHRADARRCFGVLMLRSMASPSMR